MIANRGMSTEAENRQSKIITEFQELNGWEARYKKIIQRGKSLPQMDEALYDEKYLVKGCQSQVWLHASLNAKGQMEIQADSDALIVKGLAALIVESYTELSPKDILATEPTFISELGFQEYLSPSRANGFLSMVKQVKLYAQAFLLTQA